MTTLFTRQTRKFSLLFALLRLYLHDVERSCQTNKLSLKATENLATLNVGWMSFYCNASQTKQSCSRTRTKSFSVRCKKPSKKSSKKYNHKKSLCRKKYKNPAVELCMIQSHDIQISDRFHSRNYDKLGWLQPKEKTDSEKQKKKITEFYFVSHQILPRKMALARSFRIRDH